MKVMENVELELYLGEDATSAQCTLSSAGSGVGFVGSADASWTFDSRKKVRFIGGSCALCNRSV
jgi:AP-3 complex subunit mu